MKAGQKEWAWGALLGFASFALIVKVVIALQTYGTNDVLTYQGFLTKLREVGGIALYREGIEVSYNGFFHHKEPLVSHTPFVLHFLEVMGWLSRATGLPFPFWLRLPSILADFGSVFLVWKILKIENPPSSHFPMTLYLMALSPISLMVSGFHGSIDAVLIFFVLLSLYYLGVKKNLALAGAALGMSLNFKLVALMFVPVIWFYLKEGRERLHYFAATAAVFTICSMPFILQDPLIIGRRLLSYGSTYGHWGVSRMLESNLYAYVSYFLIGKYIALAFIVWTAAWLNRCTAMPVFHRFGLTAFLFLAVTPGFGVQYLAWLVPWVVVAGIWQTVGFYFAGGVFLFSVYTYWSGSFPWYFANAWVVGHWKGNIVPLEILCWVSTIWVSWTFFTLARGRYALTAVPISKNDVR